MSTKKNQAPTSFPPLPTTPRWALSTPHAIRALQQRSGGRRKSAINRPDSARNILRQLAKITASQTKRRPSTPQTKPITPADKENLYSPFLAQDDGDIENGEELERPDFSLPIAEEDEDDNTGVAPSRKELPGEGDYTFKSIDFAVSRSRPPTSVKSERIRRVSRMSILQFPDEDEGQGPEDEDDLTAQSIEYGRRAVSEGPVWERYPRSSFGSIRMSDFGIEESRLGREPDREKSFILDDQHAGVDHEIEQDEGDETEALRHFRTSISEPVDDGLLVQDHGFLDEENTFRLEFDQEERTTEFSPPDLHAQDGGVSESEAEAVSSPSHHSSIPAPQSPGSITRRMTEIEAAAPSRAPRRKKLKLTRRGNTVPALPSSLVKRIAVDSMTRLGKKRPVITRDSLVALEQATEWFFEQVGEDLEAYSDHAKRRKRIDDTDVFTLIKRQRVMGRGQSLQELAEEFLPDDVLLNLRLPDEARQCSMDIHH